MGRLQRMTAAEEQGMQQHHSTAAWAAPAVPRPYLMARALLRAPLFFKILCANAAVVMLVAAGGVLLGAEFVRSAADHPTLRMGGMLALLAVVASVLVNAVILRTALLPLRLLQETAARVAGGDLEARAEPSILADRDLDRLVRTFNRMLDVLHEFRTRLRSTAGRALVAAEEERNRVALELHDGIAQTLAALLLRLRLARRESSVERRDAILDDVTRELTRATEEVRSIAQGLRPPALEMLGLATAIEAHARRISEASGLRVDVEAAALHGVLAPETELALYRIVQEALANVVRHAGATQVSIRLGIEHGAVVGMVEDDGRGFGLAQALAKGRGLGLFGMHERASYVGGTVDIDSLPGAGTRVRLRFPCDVAKAPALATA